ncbi:MAG: NIPSNAP family protein [Xanthobacteraceae bacterium]
MTLYELRTYTLYVGKMAEATKLYQELGFPALKKGGHDKKLLGYFQADSGTINQLVHLWKFDDDADRRKHWTGVFADKDFVEGFASKFRPLVMNTGGQAADGGAVGSTSLTASASTTANTFANRG